MRLVSSFGQKKEPAQGNRYNVTLMTGEDADTSTAQKHLIILLAIWLAVEHAPWERVPMGTLLAAEWHACASEEAEKRADEEIALTLLRNSPRTQSQQIGYARPVSESATYSSMPRPLHITDPPDANYCPRMVQI